MSTSPASGSRSPPAGVKPLRPLVAPESPATDPPKIPPNLKAVLGTTAPSVLHVSRCDQIRSHRHRRFGRGRAKEPVHCVITAMQVLLCGRSCVRHEFRLDHVDAAVGIGDRELALLLLRTDGELRDDCLLRFRGPDRRSEVRQALRCVRPLLPYRELLPGVSARAAVRLGADGPATSDCAEKVSTLVSPAGVLDAASPGPPSEPPPSSSPQSFPSGSCPPSPQHSLRPGSPRRGFLSVQPLASEVRAEEALVRLRDQVQEMKDALRTMQSRIGEPPNADLSTTIEGAVEQRTSQLTKELQQFRAYAAALSHENETLRRGLQSVSPPSHWDTQPAPAHDMTAQMQQLYGTNALPAREDGQLFGTTAAGRQDGQLLQQHAPPQQSTTRQRWWLADLIGAASAPRTQSTPPRTSPGRTAGTPAWAEPRWVKYAPQPASPPRRAVVSEYDRMKEDEFEAEMRAAA